MLCRSASIGQDVRSIPEVKVQVGRLHQVVIESDTPNVEFKVLSDKLDYVREYPPQGADKNWLFFKVLAIEEGTHLIVYCGAKDNKLTSIQEIRVIARRGIAPKPDPKPKPPDPKPLDVPFKGAPGLHTLIILERGEMAKYPSSQQSAIFSMEVRNWLSTNCVKGPDGSTPAWRIFDKDDLASLESTHFQDAFTRGLTKKTTMPWILVGNGKDGYEGPLPAGKDKLLDLLKKYGTAK
jgi:hypothetical protein